ncbi:MAG TPA: protein kinase, partial [Chroococcidiopsis sp.]
MIIADYNLTMEVYCTRPGCPRPTNYFADLDNVNTLKTVQQKFCTTCGMPLILLGRYVPSKLLGKGGFGSAFLARDRYTPAMRQCVVKLFQPAGSLSPAQLKVAQELFEREGEVLENLGNRHPEIPDLLAFFELDVASAIPNKSEKFFYLVQEFIDGENLEDELAKQGPFSETEVLRVLVSILKILQFVHDNGSIHRDIKPSNIMRHRDGRLYLLDFGAVKQVASAAAGGGQGSTGIYSMGFAPPEQMAGNVVYPATDLYALGVTCITLLTGKQPNELYDAYSNGWKWRDHAQVSDRLGLVLDRLLLATPSERFQSAKEVIEALRPTGKATSSPSPGGSAGTGARPSASTQAGPPATSATAMQQAQPPSAAQSGRRAKPQRQSQAQSQVQPQFQAQSQAQFQGQPQSQPQSQGQPLAPSPQPSFSLFELLGSAAFT